MLAFLHRRMVNEKYPIPCQPPNISNDSGDHLLRKVYSIETCCSFVHLFYIDFNSVLVGCASITIKDTLATGVPRGYLEFYYLKSEGHFGHQLAIYSIENNKKILEGCTSANDLFQDKVGFRLAKRPGTYDFAVSLGTAEEHVNQVRVEEGMVTPVRIQMGNISWTHGYNTKTIHFSLNLIVEETTPFHCW
jgi:hypothetical protein